MERTDREYGSYKIGMTMKETGLSAGKFLKKYYDSDNENNILFMYRFLAQLASEAAEIGREKGLRHMDLENAVVAVWFRYAGMDDIDTGRTEKMKLLLNDYFNEVDYPLKHRVTVQNAIEGVTANQFPSNPVEQVVSDGVYSRLADRNFIENIILLKNELTRLTENDRGELFYLKYFLGLFVKIRYYTDYANKKYAVQRQKNFEYVEKRIGKLEEEQQRSERTKFNLETSVILTNKETEDLFKLAFRNYNHLISVADSKASLLIRVNAIIISVTIAFVLGKIEKSLYILWPTILLLVVCLTTIFLAILASRPQNNVFIEDKHSHSYQRFFFGSFDMVDPVFRRIRWEEYYQQLKELLSNTKETLYMELYKESFNVRKVLSRKFSYLSLAYWVFLLGLLISVVAFVIATYSKTSTSY
jgi:Family of unknown function (DUF5706)